MLKILRKIFIKNYDDVNNPTVRESHGKLAAGFGIFSNTILVAIKLIFGIIAKSISMIGDSINNLSDGANSLITLIGFKMSSKPADKEHPFGHQRIEYITGLIVSIIVVALAIILGYQSVDKIINPVVTEYSIVSIIILSVAILLKIIQALFNFKVAKLINSVTIKAVGVDSLSDTIATSLLLISAIICYFVHDPWTMYIDGVMGIVVAIFVGYSGIKMIKETSSPLIGEATQIESIKSIINEIHSYEGVLDIHDLVAHNYGPNKIFMTVHVEIDSRTPILEAHDLVDSIENDIRKKYDVELTIHMDPVDMSNPEVIRLKQKAIDCLHQIDQSLKLHDFRMVSGISHSNLVFDVLIPFDLKIDEKTIYNKLTELINVDEKVELRLVINFDRPFME